MKPHSISSIKFTSYYRLCVLSAMCYLLVFVPGAFEIRAQAPNVMLARPTATSVTASILFETPMESYVVYGAKRGNYKDSTTLITHKAGVPDNVVMANCKSDTRYFYRIRYRKAGTTAFTSTDEFSFQTQRAQGTSFRFLIEADEHLYDKKGIRSMYQVTLDNMAKDSADFLLSLGDIFGDDHTPATTTSADMQELHKDYRQYLGDVCHSMPFFVCLGNHEGEMGYYLKQTPPDNIAVYGTLWRKYYYPNPVPDNFYSGNSAKEAFGIDLPENYYAWTWGDALFVVLDVYRHCDINEKPQNWDWTLGEAQYQWFRETLSKSTAKYKFVFAHHVRGQGRGAIDMAKGFEWGGYDNGGRWQFTDRRPGWELPIHQLMVKYGVNVFFQGHDHLFAKEELDNVVYQEVPMPSDSTYEIGVLANADAYKGITLNGTGHIRVDVKPEGVTVDYIRSYLPADTVGGTRVNREVAHSYTVQARATGVADESNTKALSAYYSASSNTINVISESAASGERIIAIHSMNGDRVLSGSMEASNTISRIDAGTLAQGVYIVTCTSDAITRTAPLTVIR